MRENKFPVMRARQLCVNPMPFKLLVVRGEVLHRRDHAFTLYSLDVSHRQTAGEIGIFTISFKISAPETECG